MAYGLLSTGFVMPTLDELIEEQYAEMRAAYGDSVDLTAASPLGQLSVINAEREFKIWQGMQAVHKAFDPDSATGASLESVSAITGTVRDFAAPSEVTGTFTGTPATVLTAGRVASVAGTGKRFATLADATIAAATAWAASTAYAAAARRTNGGNIYEVTVAGTSAASGGPTGTGTTIVDGTVTWKYLGAGTGFVDAAMESEEDGPIVATARTLTVIETPAAGWSGVINNLDAELGVDEETDPSLRLKREDELRAGGNAAIESVRAQLLKVDDVKQVTVFENITNVTDADGLPPHSIECLVQGGADAAILKAVFLAAAGGIEAHGTTSGTVTDSQGIAHTVKFTRPSEINIWIIANLVINSNEYPLDGADQIKTKLTTYGSAQKTGKNVVASALEAECFKVSGVLEASCLIATSNPPTLRTTIAISLRQLMKFDTSRITVATTSGTP